MTFKVSAPSAGHLRGLTSGLGAVLTGRHTFDVAHSWGGNHAWALPRFFLAPEFDCLTTSPARQPALAIRR